tara:strand:- start:34 stop:447 length:414 start_codon:yes stop_codon:yes gene_type:complete
MADKKISELNVVSLPLLGTEEIPIVQNGETKKVNSSEFLSDNDSLTQSISGTFNIDFNAYSNWELTLTGNTTLTFTNEPISDKEKTITIYVIGDFALTLPTEWVIKNGGTYDGVNGSQIVVQSWDNGNFYTVINNEQ